MLIVSYNVMYEIISIHTTGGPDVSASGVDYGNQERTVTFKAGSRFSTYASIPIVPNDDPGEGVETFKATFDLPGGYRNLVKGDPEEAEISIEGMYVHIYRLFVALSRVRVYMSSGQCIGISMMVSLPFND